MRRQAPQDIHIYKEYRITQQGVEIYRSIDSFHKAFKKDKKRLTLPRALEYYGTSEVVTGPLTLRLPQQLNPSSSERCAEEPTIR